MYFLQAKLINRDYFNKVKNKSIHTRIIFSKENTGTSNLRAAYIMPLRRKRLA